MACVLDLGDSASSLFSPAAAVALFIVPNTFVSVACCSYRYIRERFEETAPIEPLRSFQPSCPSSDAIICGEGICYIYKIMARKDQDFLDIDTDY